MAQATKPRTSTRAASPARKAPGRPVPPASARYWEGVGRRKTAVARVRIREGKGNALTVNSKSPHEYFQDKELSEIARQPFQTVDAPFEASVHVSGGGKHAQAEATRHGLARALVEYKGELRPQLKTLGYLKRDPRERERQKFGLKRARRARQWRKR